MAAESDSRWHEEICPILRTRELETYHPIEDLEGEHELQSLDSVLRLLGPTDDPHMLGRIGTYEIVSVIGRGGMGVVFKAFDGTLNRFVAIKMLLPHLATSGAARKRFAREGRAAAAVINDNVMPIYNVDQWQGNPYLVTQYSRGLTLQQRIQKQGPLKVKEVLRIAMQTARGLEAAHAQGLVHRDVKPSNLLLDGTVDRAMLTDFGLARAVDDASITRTGTISGTPQYMSPEQASGGNIDARSDLFSLGSVMYAMCTGRPPFRAETSYAVLRRITDDAPNPIQTINPDIPKWLCQIINKLLSKQADDRFGASGEVAELLEECLAHVQNPTSTPLPASLRGLETAKALDRSSFRFPPVVKALVAAAFAFFLIFAGVLIVVELNKGKLTIECSADDVPIRVMQGDAVVKKMTVTKSGATIRVAAGTYVVEVDGAFDDLVVQDGSVLLKRVAAMKRCELPSRISLLKNRRHLPTRPRNCLRRSFRLTEPSLIKTASRSRASKFTFATRLLKDRWNWIDCIRKSVFEATARKRLRLQPRQPTPRASFASTTLWPPPIRKPKNTQRHGS